MFFYSTGRRREYISAADRKRMAEEKIVQLRKKQTIHPIVINGRKIANTFWGKAWCTHIESYSNYENRLPRGRSYVRNGSVIDLAIKNGEVLAQVQGTRLYKIAITIQQCSQAQWDNIISQCSGKIDSLIELLQGAFSEHVMKIMVDKNAGLLPSPKEIKFSCSCPDYAALCKHVAAVMYGIGARLDENPEALFILRNVDHTQLIGNIDVTSTLTKNQSPSGEFEDLSSLFGIEIEQKTSEAKSKEINKGKSNNASTRSNKSKNKSKRKTTTKSKSLSKGKSKKKHASKNRKA